LFVNATTTDRFKKTLDHNCRVLLREMGKVVMELHGTPSSTAEPSTPVPGHLKDTTCDYFTTGCVIVVYWHCMGLLFS
jgi:hypothetical protein